MEMTLENDPDPTTPLKKMNNNKKNVTQNVVKLVVAVCGGRYQNTTGQKNKNSLVDFQSWRGYPQFRVEGHQSCWLWVGLRIWSVPARGGPRPELSGSGTPPGWSRSKSSSFPTEREKTVLRWSKSLFCIIRALKHSPVCTCTSSCPHLALVFSLEGFNEVFNAERFPHQHRDSLQVQQQLKPTSSRDE